ncbi:uncharacterized protein LOC118437711 [Folsomia candida]|uniref:Peptide chain release factor 1 n=1 Tax=Folsomia candida TaxID=158441 RepID=A0A226DNC3_FOLCA|nr:uncharacterized protein LOC118437711 [Folsomia candida]OXA46498.1 Peptide chain release factor 1 [Folsomia candida]
MYFGSKFQLIIFLGGFYLVGQIYCQDPAITALNARVTEVNNTAIANKNAITGLTTRLTNLETRQTTDYNFLNGRITTINTNLTSVYKTLKDHTADISVLASSLDAANANIAAANDQISKLQAANQVWISNWRVVNKTFAELRKKLKFTVARGAIRVVQVG